MSFADILAVPPALPVAASIDEIARGVATRRVVVQAPPGTGKTTLVPVIAARWCEEQNPGNLRVIVTQPRRVAARAAARRIAGLLGEPVGESVGYSVRGDSTTSPRTRIEMVTPGVLLRRMQSDPELAGVGAIVFDEVHERHVDSDFALAFALDIAQMREDIALVAMSATVEAGRTAALLGGGIVDVPGEIHPVDVRWAPPARGAEALGAIGGGTGVRREFLLHVAGVVRQALDEVSEGDVLVFLPGVAEVNAVCGLLARCGADVVALHGSLSPREQDAALAGGGARRVVVSTALAESSLTVPGVRVVVDAGLSREPRMDWGRGVGGLVTVRESQAAGVQRAGRAGRLGPGVAYRCMDEPTWARLAHHGEPEIATADLTDVLLESACWGAPGARGLALLDDPPAPAVAAAEETLRNLGAVDGDGRPTSLGRTLARLPIGARLGRALLLATPMCGARRAAELVAAVDQSNRVAGADFLSGWRRAAAASATWKSQVSRLENMANRAEGTALNLLADLETHPANTDEAAAVVVALAYPERIARRRANSTERYLLASGVGARLPEHSPLIGKEWLAVAELDRGQGRSDALIRAAVPIDADEAVALGSALERDDAQIDLHSGKLRQWDVHYLGAIELSRRESPTLDRQAAADWIGDQITAGKIELAWSDAAMELRHRLAFLHEHCGEPWPAMDDEALATRIDEWSGELIDELIAGRPLGKVNAAHLRTLLPWPEAANLDALAPEQIELPSGRRARVHYEDGRARLSIRLQDAFGWQETPRIAAGRLPLTLELLSPASRPLALTDDLASFWRGAYSQVRAQMRGRYPRHPWPEDPTTAEPIRRRR
ncbi:ATP-dependent helicase HrpB [Arcanobacterium haemolyticum]|nr:ATP-dependent helicase HrpB [Arcanobacterium haemolyticum]